MDVSFLLRSPSLSLISVSSSRGYHVQPTVCASGERAEVKGERWMEGEKRMKEGERERRMVARARYNKYNGWASSWRESPGDFAGFCNWNAFRGRAKQGTRWINAALLLLRRGCLYFATRLAAERQLNEMSNAILVPSLPSPSFPFAVTLRYMRLLSVSPESSTLSLCIYFLLYLLFLFFLYLFHLHHSCSRHHPYHLRSFFLESVDTETRGRDRKRNFYRNSLVGMKNLRG